MTDRNIFIAPRKTLGHFFEKNGHDLYFVGGCVRDLLVGETPHDIDFATSATPDEQIAMYTEAGLYWIAPGYEHGTVTVKFEGEFYEITTFRIDKETDGRHAVVEYTRNIGNDLARRDLTINAMAMDFDGKIIDPFGGEQDLRDGLIRFVGEPEERIAEDYLRIMRFFRFYGRFGKIADEKSMAAIAQQVRGLMDISIERIWSELAKILARTETGEVVIEMMMNAKVDRVINCVMDANQYRRAARVTSDPAMLLGYMDGYPAPFKLSGVETASMEFAQRSALDYTRVAAEADLLRGIPRDRIITALAYHGRDADVQELRDWVVPTFPVSGDDLIARGFAQGREVGQTLAKMKSAWVGSNYQMTKEQMMREFVPS